MHLLLPCGVVLQHKWKMGWFTAQQEVCFCLHQPDRAADLGASSCNNASMHTPRESPLAAAAALAALAAHGLTQPPKAESLGAGWARTSAGLWEATIDGPLPSLHHSASKVRAPKNTWDLVSYRVSRNRKHHQARKQQIAMSIYPQLPSFSPSFPLSFLNVL